MLKWCLRKETECIKTIIKMNIVIVHSNPLFFYSLIHFFIVYVDMMYRRQGQSILVILLLSDALIFILCSLSMTRKCRRKPLRRLLAEC